MDELLRRMSSRELTEWMTYFMWKAQVEAIHADAVKHHAPMSEAFAQDMAWRAVGVVETIVLQR